MAVNPWIGAVGHGTVESARACLAEVKRAIDETG